VGWIGKHDTNKLITMNIYIACCSDPDDILGTPFFVGTRVPITLLDYLEAGDSLDEFLNHFPSVHREQAIAVLELAKKC